VETCTQASYAQGSQIVIDVALTAVHMGHFVFSACPLSTQGGVEEIPTQECFDKYKLTFVEDLIYGAIPDVNYPERARPPGHNTCLPVGIYVTSLLMGQYLRSGLQSQCQRLVTLR